MLMFNRMAAEPDNTGITDKNPLCGDGVNCTDCNFCCAVSCTGSRDFSCCSYNSAVGTCNSRSESSGLVDNWTTEAASGSLPDFNSASFSSAMALNCGCSVFMELSSRFGGLDSSLL